MGICGQLLKIPLITLTEEEAMELSEMGVLVMKIDGVWKAHRMSVAMAVNGYMK